MDYELEEKQLEKSLKQGKYSKKRSPLSTKKSMKDGKQTSDSWETKSHLRDAGPKRSVVLDSLTSIFHRGHAQKIKTKKVNNH